jgi:hypothetical protein
LIRTGEDAGALVEAALGLLAVDIRPPEASIWQGLERTLFAAWDNADDLMAALEMAGDIIAWLRARSGAAVGIRETCCVAVGGVFLGAVVRATACRLRELAGAGRAQAESAIQGVGVKIVVDAMEEGPAEEAQPAPSQPSGHERA